MLLFVVACGSESGAPPPGGMVNNAGLDGSIPDASIDAANATLSSSDVVLAFGTVLVNTRSAGLTATISNQGGPSMISNVIVSGTGAAAYVIEVDTCPGATLSGAATCAAQVRFAPTTVGTADASLVVTGTGAGSTTIVLKGTGAVAGALAITPPNGSFGNVAANATHDVSFQLQNVGTTPTGAITIALSGPDAGLFQVIADNCAGGLASSASCTLTVRFSPVSVGARTATLGISDALGGTMTAALSGTGT